MISDLSLMVGHVYPIYSGFKDGKGTSTYVAVIIGITPLIGISLTLDLESSLVQAVIYQYLLLNKKIGSIS